MRILNQLIDRQLKGKYIGLIESQRSKRATNLKNSLMPRALAVFPVVAKNILDSPQEEIQFYNQLPQQGTQITQTTSRSEKNKFREYDKIEVELRK